MHDSLCHDTNWHGLDWYKRQYVGFINKKGDKILWVNCFPEPTDTPPWGKFDWIHNIYIVEDSPTTWTIKYNLNKHKLFDLTGGGIGP